MALDTYANLQSAIAGWLDRSDYTAQIPDFIRMAEAEFDRVLRTPDMEARAQASTVAGAERLALPTDCAGVKGVTLLADISAPLKGTTVSYLREVFGRAYTARHSHFAVADEQLCFGPLPDAAYPVEIVYHRRIPALTVSNTSNWLLERHPDLYLMASVKQAEFYGWNDNRLPLIKARCDEIIEQLSRDGLQRSYAPRSAVRHGIWGG